MKKLYRLSGDRKIAGVCAGLGDHFDIDPVIIRLLFLFSVFFGGLGVLAYVIMWILVPPKEGSPAEQTIRLRLHLSSSDRKIAGVCGGLGEYFAPTGILGWDFSFSHSPAALEFFSTSSFGCWSRVRQRRIPWRRLRRSTVRLEQSRSLTGLTLDGRWLIEAARREPRVFHPPLDLNARSTRSCHANSHTKSFAWRGPY